MTLTDFGIAVLVFAGRLGLLIALVGTASSTVFLGMIAVASVRHLRRAKAARIRAAEVRLSDLPAVTLLKPVHGSEPRLEENLESFFRQDYPDFEIIFGARDADNAALRVVERLKAKYPQVKARVVLSGEPEWPNAKVYSLDKMIAASRNEYLVLSDSDIVVAPDFTRNIVTPLLDRSVGCVTAMYKGIPAPDFWSSMEALGMSVELPSGVMVADMLEGMRFALGATIATRRDVLRAIGGIRATREYYSDDFVLGNLIAEAGYEVVLSHIKVGHVLVTRSFAGTFRDQLRWMQSTRYSRPKGHLGTGLTFAVPFGLLGLFAAGVLGYWTLGVGFLAAAWLNRTLQALLVGGVVIRDARAVSWCLLYPIRDLLGFAAWMGSYTSGVFHWRGEEYRFTPGGRIVALRHQRSSKEDARVVGKQSA